MKISAVVDRELWEEFRSRVAEERGLRGVSRAVEEAVEEGMCDVLVARALEEILRKEGAEPPMRISPVRPRTATDAGGSISEMRGERASVVDSPPGIQLRALQQPGSFH
ncbi:hypothetical protein NAS2_0747 [Conexivisphaera calida]|uniref:Uncharacterized protein n=1 Tax=Conexivisphaera calida TaxID=1874277 RepID=A0A4P2VC43_9ARCH|nr:hypothetical protein NAS2_0747 [Conexivisphaera calida]